MSEGPEVRRTADRLEATLVGKSVVGVVLRGRSDVAHVRDRLLGSTVQSVHTIGKNLVIAFSSGLWLRNHMLMYGKWRVYPRAEYDAGRSRAPRRSRGFAGTRARKPDRSHLEDVRRDSRLRLALLVEDAVAVQFNGPIIEFTLDDPRLAPEVRRLGPDVLSDDFDRDDARDRIRDRGSSKLADLLLDQSFVAGIGNKYKSELLFVLGLDPFRRTDSLSASERELLLEAIPRELRRAYVTGSTRDPGDPRVMERGARHWVFRRSGRPCHRCGTVVRSDVQRSARRTYFCPRCQAVGRAGPPGSSPDAPDSERPRLLP